MIDASPSLTAAAVDWPAALADRATSGDAALLALRREFPTVAIGDRGDGFASSATFEEERWCDDANDFVFFDRLVDAAAERGEFALVVRGISERAPAYLAEMLTRWQRLVRRRNPASRTGFFERLLARLRGAHDLTKPLVAADWNHAIDTWQWVLRLEPASGAALQMAALLHDVERLESEAERRVEHLAASYSAFKQRHASRGAEIALELVRAAGVDRETAERVASLVGLHEVSGDDPERALLNDADALSFFSQNSAGYVDYFGTEQARRKIAYSLRRLRPAALRRLEGVRLRRDVAALTREVRAAEGLA
jgi:hypothetical protein